MGFTNGIIVEVNSGGSDSLNGGGFSPGSSGFATDLAATGGTSAAPVVSSASYSFAAGDVGHYLFIKSGTNWTPGWYPISAASGSATLTATSGAVVLYNGATPLNTVAGCATTASPTGGTWGIDYSRNTTARITYTDLVIDGTTNTKFTSAGNPTYFNLVGNFIQVTSGTGFTTQTVEIVSATSISATCDKSLGTLSSTGGHGGLGGAFASPGGAFAVFNAVQYSTFFAKGPATHNLSASNNVSGGRITFGSSLISLIGYSTNRHHYNFDSNRPVFQSSANSNSIVTTNQQYSNIENIDFENGNSNTSVTAISAGSPAYSKIFRCVFNGMAQAINGLGDRTTVQYCWFNNITTIHVIDFSTNWSSVHNCVFTNNTNLQISPTVIEGCVFYNTTGGGGANNYITARYIKACLFHTLAPGTGVIAGGESGVNVEDCIFVGCTGAGTSCVDLSAASAENVHLVLNCGFYNNTLDVKLPVSINGAYSPVAAKIILTGDPCVNAAAGDFSLNNTAGAGALLRSVGFPTTLANALTTSARDVGPTQHTATGGATNFAF